jgi:hypothetical protein
MSASGNRFSLTRVASIEARRGLWFSKSKSDGVNIYSTRAGDTASTFLARDTVPPCVDTRPLLVAGKPEVREYKCVYVSNDEEIGQFSGEVVITCAP